MPMTPIPSVTDRRSPHAPARLEPGVLTHELVARCAADPDRPAVPTARWLLAHAYAVLAAHGATSRRRAMLQRIATLAAAYFRLFGPRADWTFAGAEVRLGTGRIDLAWATPAGHLIDEIKTSRFAVVADDGDAIDQAVGYARTACRQLADGFVGVRLLTLAIPANARFVTPSLSVVPLGSVTVATGGLS
jgi:hypothetical protein